MESLLSVLLVGQHSLVSLELYFCSVTGCVPPYFFFEATFSLNLELMELVKLAAWLMNPRHSPVSVPQHWLWMLVGTPTFALVFET